MRIFQDTFETRKRLFISDFSICVTVPLSFKQKYKAKVEFLVGHRVCHYLKT